MSNAKEIIAKRIQEIELAIRAKESELMQLIGHMNESKYMLENMFKEECEDILKSNEAVTPTEEVS